MKLRTRLNLVLTGSSAAFVGVLLAADLLNARASIREEITAANRVAAQLLGQLATQHLETDASLRQFLDGLGRVRAHDITLVSASGEVLYESPPFTWKAGRDAPAWFARLLTPEQGRQTFPLAGGGMLMLEPEPSRAVLDGWDSFVRLLAVAAVMLAAVNGAAFWLAGKAVAPFRIVADGLARVQRGDLEFRLPPLAGSEAAAIGSAFNAMAEGVADKLAAERKAREAEARLEERRELARLIEQRLEEERRLIAHELHDEFSQSVTAIRSLAMAIAARPAAADAVGGSAKLIADEAGRLYDAMHSLIPRLQPPTLESLGLGETLENLVRDWQRRSPDVLLALHYDVAIELGSSVTLTAYRVAQEGLINALRHARASRVEMDLRTERERILVTVSDDGIGLPADWARPGHFGLRGLQERVGQLGGTLEVENRVAGGVRLRAAIPLTAA